jgi:hypothetical protein
MPTSPYGALPAMGLVLSGPFWCILPALKRWLLSAIHMCEGQNSIFFVIEQARVPVLSKNLLPDSEEIWFNQRCSRDVAAPFLYSIGGKNDTLAFLSTRWQHHRKYFP